MMISCNPIYSPLAILCTSQLTVRSCFGRGFWNNKKGLTFSYQILCVFAISFLGSFYSFFFSCRGWYVMVGFYIQS